MAETQEPGFEKQVVRLPDGRRLIYYRFPSEPPRPGPAPSPARPAAKPGSREG